MHLQPFLLSQKEDQNFDNGLNLAHMKPWKGIIPRHLVKELDINHRFYEWSKKVNNKRYSVLIKIVNIKKKHPRDERIQTIYALSSSI